MKKVIEFPEVSILQDKAQVRIYELTLKNKNISAKGNQSPFSFLNLFLHFSDVLFVLLVK